MKLCEHLPDWLKNGFSRDPDKRRLHWLCYRARLEPAHAAALRPILEKCRQSLGKGREWATAAERTTIQVMFNIYRGPRVHVRGQ